MNIFYYLKIVVAYVAYKTSLIKYLIKKNSHIIAYHNVIEDKYFDDAFHLGFSHSLSNFKNQLQVLESFYKKYNNIDKLVITFDDGYRNNYKTIKNVVADKVYKVIFFISPNRRLEDAPFWIDKLLYACSYLDPGSYNIGSQKFKLTSSDYLHRLVFYKNIYNFILDNYDKKDELVKIIYNEVKENSKGCSPNSDYFDLRFNFMNEDEIIELSNYKNIQIGYHTRNHDNLKIHDIKNLKDELNLEKKFIDKYNIIDFAYPFGGKDEINIDIIDDLIDNGFQKIYSAIPEQVDKRIISRNSIPNIGNKYLILAYYSNLFSFLKSFF